MDHPKTPLHALAGRSPARLPEPITGKLPSGRPAPGSAITEPPLEILDRISIAIADFEDQHGQRPSVLKLPARQAWRLITLGRNYLGEVMDHASRHGVDAFGMAGLFGLKVTILRDQTADFTIE